MGATTPPVSEADLRRNAAFRYHGRFWTITMVVRRRLCSERLPRVWFHVENLSGGLCSNQEQSAKRKLKTCDETGDGVPVFIRRLFPWLRASGAPRRESPAALQGQR